MNRSPKRLAVAFVASAVVLAQGCHAQAPESRSDRWKADFEMLRKEFPRRQIDPWARLPHADWERGIHALESLPLEKMGDPEIAGYIEQLLARFRDGHIHILTDGTSAEPLLLPVRFRWFDSGLYVVASEDEHIRGAKLLSLGGLPAAEALKRVTPWASFENESGLHALAFSTLANDAVLVDAGIAEAGKPVPVILQLQSGKQETVLLQPQRIADIRWRQPNEVPAHRRERTPANWITVMPERQALYLRYAECHDENGNRALARQMETALQRDSKLTVVIDLRGNEGGDSAAFASILKVVRTEGHKGKHLVLALTDRNTFSSAFRNSVELRAAGARVMGEAPSQRPVYTGDVRSFILPNSHIVVRYTTKWSRLGTADAMELTPDVLVQPSVQQYLAGEDPVLERALSEPAG